MPGVGGGARSRKHAKPIDASTSATVAHDAATSPLVVAASFALLFAASVLGCLGLHVGSYTPATLAQLLVRRAASIMLGCAAMGKLFLAITGFLEGGWRMSSNPKIEPHADFYDSYHEWITTPETTASALVRWSAQVAFGFNYVGLTFGRTLLALTPIAAEPEAPLFLLLYGAPALPFMSSVMALTTARMPRRRLSLCTVVYALACLGSSLSLVVHAQEVSGKRKEPLQILSLSQFMYTVQNILLGTKVFGVRIRRWHLEVFELLGWGALAIGAVGFITAD